MERVLYISDINGSDEFQNVTLRIVNKSQYRVILMGGVDYYNNGTYGTNKTLGEYIETIATSKKYNIPLQKGDIQIINSPMFSKEANAKDIYNEILKIIVKDFDIKNGVLILYGYSWGGQLLMEFLDNFQRSKINIDLLITIDAAKGPFSFSVNNDITSNVKRNLNIYQTHPSPIGSHGGYNEGNGKIKNIDLSKEKNSKGEPIVHSNIDEYTLLFIAQVIVYALKGIYSYSSLSDVDIKKAIKTYSSNGY
ncbi:MAG TPA: hypothetical protein VF677_05170 [Flavobacterium sp.]|jgi:hypothetical protein